MRNKTMLALLLALLMVLPLIGHPVMADETKTTETTADAESSASKKHKEDKEEEEEETHDEAQEDLELSDWDGEWPSYARFLAEEALAPLMLKMAALNFEETDGYIEKQLETYTLPFDLMLIEDEKIILKKDDAILSEAVYERTGVQHSKYGRHHLTWTVFETSDENALFKTFAMMPAHGHGDGPEHIHFRYGNEPIEEIMAKDDWFPTCLGADVTVEFLVSYYEKTIAKMEEEMQAKEKDLSEFEGVWNNYMILAKDEALKDLLTRRAELQDKSYDELIQGMEDMNQLDFDQMKIDDETISIFKDGEEVFSGQFEKAGVAKKEHGRREIDVYVFSTDAETDEYKHFLLMPPHGKIMHMHFFFGGGSVRSILDKTGWWPTVFEEAVSVEDYVASTEKRVAREEENAKNKVELDLWEGKWDNIGTWLEREDVQHTYAIQAEKEGITPEEYKKNYLAYRDCAFDGIEIDGETVRFFDSEGELMGEGVYRYSSMQTVEDGRHSRNWYHFSTSDKDAPFSNLLLMKVHGDELVHFHLLYGDERVKEILAKENWLPTVVSPDSTLEQMIAELTE